MIPIVPQQEPADFDVNVRQKGLGWLFDKQIAWNSAPPKSYKLPKYWSYSHKQLWEAYSGICAYLAIFIAWPMGASSTDHFIAKSKHAGLAYEWDNYRLSCLGPNRNKNIHNILDPVGLVLGTFVLNLSSGEITPDGSLVAQQLVDAQNTIKYLKLDSPEHNEMRAKHFSDYIRGDISMAYLQNNSPFVHFEASRQGLL